MGAVDTGGRMHELMWMAMTSKIFCYTGRVS